MKTEQELRKMTKTELDTYGNEVFGIDLDSRRTKDDMVADLLEIQAKQAESGGGDVDPGPDPDARSKAPAAPKDMVTVTVTRCPATAGVDLVLNGKSFHLPINQPTPVPPSVAAALRQAVDVAFTEE
ncbi:MAG: Rho termination factor N-terminal domain-containing protein [Salinisphaeraceae bacterium]